MVPPAPPGDRSWKGSGGRPLRRRKHGRTGESDSEPPRGHEMTMENGSERLCREPGPQSLLPGGTVLAARLISRAGKPASSGQDALQPRADHGCREVSLQASQWPCPFAQARHHLPPSCRDRMPRKGCAERWRVPWLESWPLLPGWTTLGKGFRLICRTTLEKRLTDIRIREESSSVEEVLRIRFIFDVSTCNHLMAEVCR